MSDDFMLEQLYKLYIPLSARSLEFLFQSNHKIKNIFIDNWDSSRMLDLSHAFGYLHLKSFPDFSKQDFYNVENMEGMFSGTKIQGDIVLKNKRMNNLKNTSHMFAGATADNIILDIETVDLKDAFGMFAYTRCNELKMKITHTSDLDLSMFLNKCKIQYIDIKDLNVKKCFNMDSFFNFSNIGKVIMPNTIPDKIKDVYVLSDEVKKIYCNKKWEKLLKE